MSDTIKWASLVRWSEPDGTLARTASVGEFELRVQRMNQAFDACPSAAWHYMVRYQGIVACHGFALDTATGEFDCMRTAVKMALWHGMVLDPGTMARVGHLLVDPHGGKRRVAIDGHSAKSLARAFAQSPIAADDDAGAAAEE